MELSIISLLLALLYTIEDMYPLYWIILYVGLLICQMCIRLQKIESFSTKRKDYSCYMAF